MQTYLQPSRPPLPSSPLRMPAARMPPKPLATVFPQYTIATRTAISDGLYQELIRSLPRREISFPQEY